MSELENKLNDLSEQESTETLKDLKAQADLMGIKYPANANVKKMVELIDEHKKNLEKENTEAETTSNQITSQKPIINKIPTPASIKNPLSVWLATIN